METGLKSVGYALSGCTQNFLNFVVMETERVKVNNFYFLKHPLNPETNVLARIYRIQPYNPEMITGRTGPLAGKKGRKAEYGKKLEYILAYAEILGYYDERYKWRSLEAAPSPWDVVYEPDEEALKKFLMPEKFSSEALVLEVGRVRGTNIPIYLDLNLVAKAHMLVAGMTRSGKSSFLINLMAKASKLNLKPRFIIFDRRSEYGALTKYGAVIIPYNKFTPPITDAETIVKKLGIKRTEKEVVVKSIQSLQAVETDITRENLLKKLEEVAEATIKNKEARERVLQSIQWHLDQKGKFMDETLKPMDIIQSIKEKPILIIDFSVDTDFESQQRTATRILNTIRNHAMERKDYGDFAGMVVVEEAQYLAPERGFEILDSPAQSEAKMSMVETISQAGGYNIGIIVMTQRPAYVLKSVISQCNTVVCFRLKSGNDQDAILQYTEYGSERLREYLPGLADHEAMVWGLAIPTPFPIIAEFIIEEYPRKAATLAKQAWGKMGLQQ